MRGKYFGIMFLLGVCIHAHAQKKVPKQTPKHTAPKKEMNFGIGAGLEYGDFKNSDSVNPFG